MSAGKGQRDLKKELRNRNVQLSTTEAGKKKKNYIEGLEDFSSMLCAGPP